MLIFKLKSSLLKSNFSSKFYTTDTVTVRTVVVYYF